MAPRQTARRLLVAAPVLTITALSVLACSPPHQQPADPDAPYTLPTYSEPASEEGSHSTSSSTPATSETTTPAAESDAPGAAPTGTSAVPTGAATPMTAPLGQPAA